MKPYVTISKKQANAVVLSFGKALPIVDNGMVKLECGAILRRMPQLFRKGKDKARALAYRLSADNPAVLSPLLSLISDNGKSVCLCYETDQKDLQEKIEAARLRNDTTMETA